MMKVTLNERQLNVIQTLHQKKDYCQQKLNEASIEINNALQLLIPEDLSEVEKVEIVENHIEYSLKTNEQ